MPVYKLTYFNVTGVAEPIRYILSYANEKFEDVRIDFENWPEKKKLYPLGKLPLLEIDGNSYNQSVAIARNLAKKYKLNGKDDIEDMLMDAAVDCVCDMRTACAKYYFEKDPEKKKTGMATLQNEIIPVYFNYLENLIKENGGYLVNGHISWADLFLVSTVSYFLITTELNFLEDHPNIQALVKKIKDIPGIKNYIETSPKPLF